MYLWIYLSISLSNFWSFMNENKIKLNALENIPVSIVTPSKRKRLENSTSIILVVKN